MSLYPFWTIVGKDPVPSSPTGQIKGYPTPTLESNQHAVINHWSQQSLIMKDILEYFNMFCIITNFSGQAIVVIIYNSVLLGCSQDRLCLVLKSFDIAIIQIHN